MPSMLHKSSGLQYDVIIYEMEKRFCEMGEEKLKWELKFIPR